jgi:hypothetical protein
MSVERSDDFNSFITVLPLNHFNFFRVVKVAFKGHWLHAPFLLEFLWGDTGPWEGTSVFRSDVLGSLLKERGSR